MWLLCKNIKGKNREQERTVCTLESQLGDAVYRGDFEEITKQMVSASILPMVLKAAGELLVFNIIAKPGIGDDEDNREYAGSDGDDGDYAGGDGDDGEYARGDGDDREGTG
ncbi:hypothetical protein NE237_031126 [Protea cynaroides]|uniref:Uncharacterized protein n=1 Tax=Protea cynaroides TaxID=273540 RepID=A0A9Q0L1L8_9MAGN|nr:hypothetical protein NE237_031126 [Protea cynaroides]